MSDKTEVEALFYGGRFDGKTETVEDLPEHSFTVPSPDGRHSVTYYYQRTMHGRYEFRRSTEH